MDSNPTLQYTGPDDEVPKQPEQEVDEMSMQSDPYGPATEQNFFPPEDQQMEEQEQPVPKQVQIVESQDVSSDKYVKDKSMLIVRMKPLGVGEVDDQKKLSNKNEYQNKEYVGCSHEDNTITFKDLTRKDMQVFNYPDMVVPDDFNNKRLFDDTVAHKIPYILDGFNMIILAYGQTGSGKTHTMVGKLGVFKNPPSDNLDNLDDNLGIFPRAALAIFQGLQQKKEKNFMTINLSQSVGRDPEDLTTKQPIWMDPSTNELMGGKEFLIEKYEDIFNLGALFESERTVGATRFNSTSSRSHAMIWIRIYTLVGDNKLRINSLKILDLAGSERLSQVQDYKDNDQYMVSLMNNWSLTILSQVASQLAELKKPIINGNKIPGGIRWKEMFTTRVMKEAFNGLAFLQFIFCAKQHDHNSGETYSTLIFAERFKKMNGKVCRPPTISLSQLIKNLGSRIKENQRKNENFKNSKRQDTWRVTLNGLFIDTDSHLIEMLTTKLLS